MKLDRHLMLRASVLSILVAGVWTVGCGAESPDVPDDDGGEGNGGSGMGGTGQGGSVGGTPSVGGSVGVGGTPSGGAFPTGGSAGTFPTGGSSGTFPTGGSAGIATGGSAGSGTACGSTMAAPGDTSIDDLEDGENGIKMPRVGYWYTYNDGTTCAQMPAPDPTGVTPFPPTMSAGMGMFAAKTSGAACTTWGAGMGFDLANCNSKSGAYNASAFNGISFWYKSTTAIRVLIGTMAIIPTTRGGTCTPGAGMGMECDNAHGLDLPANAAGGPMAVPFTMLNQVFGQMKAFDKTQIVNIQWQVAQALAFDFTIDDVAFTP